VAIDRHTNEIDNTQMAVACQAIDSVRELGPVRTIDRSHEAEFREGDAPVRSEDLSAMRRRFIANIPSSTNAPY
jgi:hypothetical protein